MSHLLGYLKLGLALRQAKIVDPQIYKKVLVALDLPVPSEGLISQHVGERLDQLIGRLNLEETQKPAVAKYYMLGAALMQFQIKLSAQVYNKVLVAAGLSPESATILDELSQEEITRAMQKMVKGTTEKIVVQEIATPVVEVKAAPTISAQDLFSF